MKVLAVGVVSVISDIDFALKKLHGEEEGERGDCWKNALTHLMLLKELLLLRRDVIIKEPQQLPTQVCLCVTEVIWSQ